MPKIAYADMKFRTESLGIIDNADDILNDYANDGYCSTVRQLYYQFITRDLFPESWYDEREKTKNTKKNYKNRFVPLMTKARMGGFIDWEHIEDRTRNLNEKSHWDSPGDIIDTCANGFAMNLWEGQKYYVEVWIEKDALIGVIERACKEYDVPYLSTRGYDSISEMWRASNRLQNAYDNEDKTPIIIHLSDHDPSGIDMTRDIKDRLHTFGMSIEVLRVGLNMDQINTYNPPPNFAKLGDSRADAYVMEFGTDSWELDALEPSVLNALIEKQINAIVDIDLFEEMKNEQKNNKNFMRNVSENWDGVVNYLEDHE